MIPIKKFNFLDSEVKFQGFFFVGILERVSVRTNVARLLNMTKNPVACLVF